jgi:hypothetical protein
MWRSRGSGCAQRARSADSVRKNLVAVTPSGSGRLSFSNWHSDWPQATSITLPRMSIECPLSQGVRACSRVCASCAAISTARSRRCSIPMLEAAGKQWLSFNAREDHLSGLTTGGTVSVMRNGADDAFKAVITKLRPLGTFATWQGIMTATPSLAPRPGERAGRP